jgi:hypothetical protein
MAVKPITYALIFALACAWTPLAVSVAAREDTARHHRHKRHWRGENQHGDGIAAVRRYDGPSIALEQVPGHLKPHHKPRDPGLYSYGGGALYRSLCRNGAPRRECVGGASAYDSGQLVGALLNPPSPRTAGAVRFFGLPDVDGAPPVALLAKPQAQVPPFHSLGSSFGPSLSAHQ